MIIQSKKVWIADQFFAAAIEVEDGKIVNVLPYGSTFTILPSSISIAAAKNWSAIQTFLL